MPMKNHYDIITCETICVTVHVHDATHVLVKSMCVFPRFQGQSLFHNFAVLLFMPPRRQLCLTAALAAVRTIS